MFQVLMPDMDSRARLIGFLKAKGILAVSHYVPLNTSPMGLTLGGAPGQCPVCEDISERLLRLPFYNDLTEADQEEVIGAILEFTV